MTSALDREPEDEDSVCQGGHPFGQQFTFLMVAFILPHRALQVWWDQASDLLTARVSRGLSTATLQVSGRTKTWVSWTAFVLSRLEKEAERRQKRHEREL